MIGTLCIIILCFVFPVQSYVSTIPGDNIIRSAIINSTAELPCNILPIAKNDEIRLILWFRKSSVKPIYVFDWFDMRSNATADTYQRIYEITIKEKYSFVFEKEEAFLRIENLEADDEGEYRCRIDYKSSPTKNVIVELKIIYPPSNPIIKDSVGRILHEAIGPFFEGENLKLICEVENGKPFPTVYWWKGDEIIDNTFTVLESSVKNSMEIDRLSRINLKETLDCKASNNNISKPVSSTVTIDMNLKPLNAKIFLSNDPMSEEGLYNITCVAIGSRPAPMISWFLEGKQLYEAYRQNTNQEFSSTVQLRPKLSDDGKFLLCRVQNPKIPEFILEDKKLIRVNFKPVVEIRNVGNVKYDDVKETSDLNLECHIKANPAVKEIGWKRNGKDVSSDKNIIISANREMVLLKNVSRLTSGNYSCYASNSEGSSESKRIPITVFYSPVCLEAERKKIFLSFSETTVIVCNVSAIPKPHSYKWLLIRPDSETVQLEMSQDNNVATNTLNYSVESKSSFGIIQCYANNDIGQQKSPCQYELIHFEIPKSPKNCIIWNNSITTYEIQCNERIKSDVPQEFVMNIKEKNNNTVAYVLVNKERPYFYLSELEENQIYILEIYARNLKGRSESVHMEIRTPKGEFLDPEASSISSLIQYSPLLEITLGFMVGIALLLISVCLVVRFQVRHSRRPQLHLLRPATEWKRINKSRKEICSNSILTNPDIIPYKSVQTTSSPDETFDDRYVSKGNAYISLPSRQVFEDATNKIFANRDMLSNNLTQKSPDNKDLKLSTADFMNNYGNTGASYLGKDVHIESEVSRPSCYEHFEAEESSVIFSIKYVC